MVEIDALAFSISVGHAAIPSGANDRRPCDLKRERLRSTLVF